MTLSRYRVPIVIVLVTVVILVAGWVRYASAQRGIRITVLNTGQETVRDMTVYVTGASYPLGDLAPSTSRTCKVSPTSESHVELEFADEQRGRIRLNAGGYFEPGYQGTMEIQVRDGKATRVKDDISIY
jgi:hypothetical protein